MTDSAKVTLRRNEFNRWEFAEVELTSGSLIEICMDGTWILGVIEYWHDGYYWFSRHDGIPVILHSGIKARLPNPLERRPLP
jgi:hypothetical protein